MESERPPASARERHREVRRARGPARAAARCGTRGASARASATSATTEPVVDGTAFHAGSIAKALTGLVILDAARNGDLDLDAPCAAQGEGLWPETPRDAAVTDQRADPTCCPRTTSRSRTSSNASLALPLVHAPGRFSYCNAGWSVLDLLLRRTTGRTFEQAATDALGRETTFGMPAGAAGGHIAMPGQDPVPVPATYAACRVCRRLAVVGDGGPAARLRGAQPPRRQRGVRRGRRDRPCVRRQHRSREPRSSTRGEWAGRCGTEVHTRRSAGPGTPVVTGRSCGASRTRTPLSCCSRTVRAAVRASRGQRALRLPPPGPAGAARGPRAPRPVVRRLDVGRRAGRQLRSAHRRGPRSRPDRAACRAPFGLAEPTLCERLGGDTFNVQGNPPGSTPIAFDEVDLIYVGPFALPRTSHGA